MLEDTLILGASAESLHAIDVAHQHGYNVIALDGSPSAAGLAAADASAVVDITNADEVMAFLDGRRPAAILPVPIGRALVSTGRMNDILDLPGVREKTADYCTDKYAFARGLFGKQLRDAKCLLASDVMTDPTALDRFTFPVIVKPRYGSGSRGVVLVENRADVLMRLSKDDIVEECCPGIEYGMDGIVKDGSLLVLMLREKVNTKPPVRQCIGYLTVPRSDKVYSVVEPYMDAVVSEIGLEDGLFHADIMVGDGKPFAIEVSARPSGHSISSDLVALATGYDPLELFLDCCVLGGELPSAPDVQRLFMGFFDFGACEVIACPDPDYLKSKYGLLRYVQNFDSGTVFGDTVDGTVTERGKFIMRAGQGDPLEHMASLLDEFEIRHLDARSL